MNAPDMMIDGVMFKDGETRELNGETVKYEFDRERMECVVSILRDGMGARHYLPEESSK